MKVKYECDQPGHDWEELDLVNGFAFAVVIDPADPDGIIAHALGQKFSSVLYWLMDEELQRIVFDEDEGAHVIRHLTDAIMAESGTGNGHSDVEQVDAAEEEYHVGFEEPIGPTDEELDAWLDARFGVEPATMKPYKARVGHRFNLPFARALIEFGRSFT